ncbi:hypothetical protein [Roseivivax sp. CAU 1753]
MADVQISIKGSLGDDKIEFAANEFGHAHAINEAIAYLTRLQMHAINSDHEAREQREEGPRQGWIKKEFSRRTFGKG